jgi:acyl-CoA reductase-like NAD-dependent aldehyde dehydrogenase
VVNIISSPQVAVAEVLTTSPDVDVVTFTGSTPTGRRIMAAAAATIKRVFLELGGKSALVVLDDVADLAGPAMVGTFATCSHSGQGCAITSRMVVPREKMAEATEAVAAMFDGVTYGDPTDANNYMGPLITEEQRQKVHGLVTRAVAAGATLVRGGEPVDGPGFYYKPTLLTNVDPDSEIAQEEAFGPVLVIIAHDGDDDAVRIANNSIYGLSGAVFATDEERGLKVARRIRSGTVGVNGGAWFGPDSPFGGYKQSGVGREMGVAGLREFLESKTLAVPHE